MHVPLNIVKPAMHESHPPSAEHTQFAAHF